MGFFSISSILYNLRKIFKYLSFSLIIISFIVVCLLLSSSNVSASSADIVCSPKGQGIIDLPRLFI